MYSLVFLLACATEPAPPEAPASSAPAPRDRRLTLAAYTTPREAYGKAILPAFAAAWKAKTGEVVTFEESYQGSGAQARAVKEGFEADVVALSLEPDIQVLEEAGLVRPQWREAAHGGMVSRSVAVIAVRPGNPKQIQGWKDLARPDVEVLTPNVRTSGGAMWNVLAIWGAGRRGHEGVKVGDDAGALGLLKGVLGRVSVMDKGARESLINFEKGVGDAAITYENEVLVARMEGKPMDYVVPQSTILIENPVAVVDYWASRHGNEDLAKAFVEFLHGPEAQAAYVKYGLRPVAELPEAPVLPTPTDLFTIKDLGGWGAVQTQVFAREGVYDQATQK